MDPATRDHAETLLLKAARAYGFQVRREEVQSAIDDPHHGTAFAEWATKHLISDCLLSVDELALYADLDRSGQVDRLAALHDLAEVQAVDEGDLRLAIQELEQSTHRISLQTKTLRQQQDALSRLVGKDSENDARRQGLGEARQRKVDADRRLLSIEVEELSRDVGFRLSDAELQCRDASPNISEIIGGLFKSDDKLLSSLQKLGWELHQPSPDEQQTVDRLREICSRLIKITVQTVRIKLDTVYLDSLVTAERSGHVKPATVEEVKALEEEVESLYSEILPVTQMSVEKQHLEPAIKSITAKTGNSLCRTTEALAYINDCLDHLLDRTARLRAHIAALRSHQAATVAIASIARAEIAQATSPPKPPGAGFPASPVRRPSPVRIGATATGAHGRHRSSSIQDQPAIEMLVQNLGLSVPFLSTDEGTKQVEFLAGVLADRSQKAAEVVRGAQESFEMSIESQLQDGKLAVQLVRDGVFAESPFGEVNLVDPELEESILVLEQELGKARERLRAVGKLNLTAKSEKRDEILRRFG
ncbi:hypothetical protein HRG_003998 [Hirsutella rhossiliensis]|uniref:Uncharacterized protein n=1 Tax=Hirsutella rhossiliensis TaxID=111463 RepID=A0A9P8N7D1_9HYPO|nr:uncharacterized protein HRG_03998 [Hirsutella rhossiliensis]KAH0965982.1 hypothetical protein HRG_03998 [Hirsutella rhossiliensis]